MAQVIEGRNKAATYIDANGDEMYYDDQGDTPLSVKMNTGAVPTTTSPTGVNPANPTAPPPGAVVTPGAGWSLDTSNPIAPLPVAPTAPITQDPTKPVPSTTPGTNPPAAPKPAATTAPAPTDSASVGGTPNTAPTPFQTTDPLAFMPLPVATAQMSPSTPPVAPSVAPAPTPAPTPAAPVDPYGSSVDTSNTSYSPDDLEAMRRRGALPDDGSIPTPPQPQPAALPLAPTTPAATTPVPTEPAAPALAPTAQMSPSTPTTTPANPPAPTATTAAPMPAHWDANDPRTQTEILQEDYGGDLNAFLAASPSAAVSAMYSDPSYRAANAAGLGVAYSPLGGNGSLIDSVGKTVAGPDAHLAQVAMQPMIDAGFSFPGVSGTPTPGVTTDANGLPTATSASSPSFTPSPPTPAVTVPAPTLAPMPWETPVSGATVPAPARTSSASGSTTPSPAASPATTVSPSSVPTQSATPAPSTDANGLPALPTSSGAMSAVTLTPTTPQNALTNMTISPGALADRYATAMTRYNDWQRQTDPQFQAAERDRLRYAAANGTIGAGSTATSINDIEQQREADMRTKRDSFLADALNGSIDDAYRNIGIAQQQQQFQSGEQSKAFGQQVTLQQLTDSELGQQFSQLMTTLGFNAQQVQQAFENAYRVQQLSDDETGQAFYRALQQFLAGNSGDPAAILAQIAGQYARGGGYSAAA